MGKKLQASIAAVAITASVGAPIIERQTREPRVCTAEVVLFEDGSWMGGEIHSARGTLIAPRWDVTGPELQNTVTTEIFAGAEVPTYHSDWPVSQNGQLCKIIA